VSQKKWLVGSSCAGGVAMLAAALAGVRDPIAVAVAGLAALAVAAFAGAVLLDGTRYDPVRTVRGLGQTLRAGRRQYAGFVIHLGLMSLAVGVTGSSLGKREQGFQMTEGQTVDWAGRSIRLAHATQRELPDKLAAEAVLEISRGGRWETTLVPAQHYHKLSQEWTTEVAIHSTWGGDLYTILHSGTPDGQLSLTFVENPLMRWLWMGGAIMILGTCLRLWPGGRRSRDTGGCELAEGKRRNGQTESRSTVPPPLSAIKSRNARSETRDLKI
jgi:cytochrome c-type biogenesis protein CcmF